MKITEHTPLFQSASTATETVAVESSPSKDTSPAEISPEESLVLHALNPATWLSARMVVAENVDSSSQEIEFELPNREKLLNSLMQAEINIEAAQSFIGEVGNLLSDLRSQYGLPEHSQAYLLIETTQETLMLDPQRLDPLSLFSAFSSAKAQLNPQELQANHSALADLAAQAVAGMRSEPSDLSDGSPPLLFSGFDLTGSSPEDFLTQLQTFEVPSAQTLTEGWLTRLRSLPSTANAGVPESPEAPSDSGQDSEMGSGLGSDTEELIRRANALEEGLNLAPKPNSPDILELFRAFLKIFLELDLALNEIAATQDFKRKEKAGILAEFGEQLQANMRLSREKLNKLRLEAHEELREGLDLLKKQLGAQAALLSQTDLAPRSDAELLEKLKQLQDWALQTQA